MSFDRIDCKKLNLSLIPCSLLILLSFLPLNTRSQLWTAGSGWNMPSPAPVPAPAPAPTPCPPCPPAPIKYIAIEIPKIVRVPGPPPPAPPALPAPAPPPPPKKHQTIIPITIPLITSHEGQGWGH